MGTGGKTCGAREGWRELRHCRLEIRHGRNLTAVIHSRIQQAIRDSDGPVTGWPSLLPARSPLLLRGCQPCSAHVHTHSTLPEPPTLLLAQGSVLTLGQVQRWPIAHYTKPGAHACITHDTETHKDGGSLFLPGSREMYSCRPGGARGPAALAPASGLCREIPTRQWPSDWREPGQHLRRSSSAQRRGTPSPPSSPASPSRRTSCRTSPSCRPSWPASGES